FVIAMIFSVLLGVLIEYLFLRPAKHPSILGMIVITLGAEMFLMGLASWKWGAEQKFFSLPLNPSVTYEPVKGMIINNWAIAVFAVTACIMLFLYIFFMFTKLGVAMRATQQNKHAAKIMGIRTERVFSFAWGFSSLIGAVAGMFFASRATLDPAFMMEPFLRAFAAAVLGGLMSIPGVIIGGALMGLIENFFGYFWPHWKPIIAFIVIILVLCLRPSGLFAKHYVKKV
ncbi:MAG: branched-chain amino acid ABC transporter permease, partial [Syntrophales bacterium]|nr:branched-chain amino acid ABC transporter permease [Syntrophales bacterium]